MLYLCASFVLRRLGFDDPRDVFAVHAVPGFWGLVSGPLFNWHMNADKFHRPTGWACDLGDDGACRRDSLLMFHGPWKFL